MPSRKALEQFSPSHAIYSRGLNTEVIGGDADGQADRPKRFSCGAKKQKTTVIYFDDVSVKLWGKVIVQSAYIAKEVTKLIKKMW